MVIETCKVVIGKEYHRSCRIGEMAKADTATHVRC